MKRYLHVITYILFAIVAMSAAGKVDISGKIIDENGEPLEFASVRIVGTAIGATSGLDGMYKLSCPANDTVRIVYTCIGYKDVKRMLLDPSGAVTLNIQMQPQTIELEGVTVTEYQKQIGANQKIDVNNYRHASDASGGSVESLITTMAGANSNNELSSRYSVRGGSYDENSVYINGIEVYRPQLVSSGQQEGLSVINPDMVDAIGFSTGGFEARYGDKMSSVLDITYRTPQSFEGSVSASLMGVSTTIGASTKHFSMLHGVRYKSNASLLSSLEDRGEYDPKYFDYQTSMSYSISPKFKASVLGNISINNYKFIPANRTTNFGTANDAKQFKVYFDGQEKDRFETFFGALSLNYMASKGTDFTLLASGYLTNELVTYDISGEYWLDQAGTSGGTGSSGVGGELGVGRYQEHARNRLKASVLSIGINGRTGLNKHSLNYGINLSHESIRDRAREWEMRDSAGYSLPADPNALKVIYNLDSRHDIASTRFGAFIQDTYRVQTSAGYLNVTGGLRASYWSFNKEFLLSPRINLGFVPDRAPRWAFRFATGLYYQSPFYKEYRQPITDADGNTIIQLNENIKSQRSVHFILGSDYTFRAFERPFKISAEAYYKLLGNLIPYEIDNLKVTYSGVNASKGYTAGIDFKLFGQFVPGSDSWFSFSLMKTQEDLNGVKVPRPTDQRYSFALFFTDYFPKFPKLKFNLRGIFSDGLPTTAPRSSRDKGYFRAPAYKRVDVGLSYALLGDASGQKEHSGFWRHFKSIWIGVDCFNLLDISNVSSYYWVTDVNDIQYAVPNYLTRRQFNVRLTIDF